MSGEFSSIRILHVDDDPDFAELSATVLEDKNERFSVETVTSAREGTARLTESEFDCIVSDYEMPGEDGIEFLDTIRGEYPDLPFILFTGKGSETVASEAISAGTTDYLQKGGGTEQFVLLANRITNAVELYRARQQAGRHERINKLIRNINRQLVTADTVETVERVVCESIAESDPYLFAWIGEPDTETGEIVPRTSAGDAESYLDEVTIRYDGSAEAKGPGGKAMNTRERQLVQSIPDEPSFEPWQEAAEKYGYESVIVLPLTADGTLHGILAIYADQHDAFDESEQEVLAELAETTSKAITTVSTRQELGETNAVLRTILENLTVGVLVEDSERRILVANETLCEILSVPVSPDDLVGRDCATAAEEMMDLFEDPEAFLTGVNETVERRDPVWNEQVELADGRTVERDFVPYTHPNGDASLWIYRDVTEQTEHQKALEILQQRTEKLMHTTTEQETAQVAVDTVHDVLDVELSGVHLLADDEETLEPAAFVDTVRDELGTPPIYDRTAETDPASAIVWDAFESGEPLVIDDVREYGRLAEVTPARSAIIHPLDGYGVFILSSTDVNDFDETDNILADVLATALTTALDRAARERELRRQNERLEKFTSVVSHDLRNPLNVIGLRLELAQEESPSDHLATIERAHERMETLIEDLLTLAREGGHVSDTSSIGLADLVEGCWENVETSDASLVTETTRTIRADRSRLQQLVENLIRNSVEHGGKDVTVTVGDLSTGFYVSDDGPGIPEDEREHMFEAGHSTLPDGTGFGLSIVDQIVEAHGWNICITESEAGGARFEITGVEFDDT